MSLERTSDVVLLVVETKTGDAEEELALRQAVGEVLGLDDANRPWRVERLFPAVDPEPSVLDRFFRLSGSVDAPPQHFEQAAFEISYRVSDETGFLVRPDLPSSFFAPVGEDIAEAEGAEAEAPHLPESESRTWALDAIHCREAWAVPPDQGGASRGEGIVIAHPDTGYTVHRDTGVAAFDLRRDRDLLDNDDDALDPMDTWTARPLTQPGHGTSTASVLAARKLTSIEGVAPKATIVPLRTVKSVVQVFDSDVARAVEYARRTRAHVVSMSLGGTGFFGLREVIDAAVEDGIIVLAAAGNFTPFVVAPASYPNCIAVAATNAADQPWEGSARGDKVAVSAPGESVWVATYAFDATTGPRSQLRRHHGTSFAVAHTAGTAALWLAHHDREALSQRYGKSRLQALFLHMIATHGHHLPSGWDRRKFGVGILDARALLEAPLPAPSVLDERVEAAPQALASASERISVLFSDLTTAEVERRLAIVFGVEEPLLSVKVAHYEVELVRILTEHPETWNAFMGITDDATEPPTAGTGAEMLAGPNTAPSIARFGSPSLNASLAG